MEQSLFALVALQTVWAVLAAPATFSPPSNNNAPTDSFQNFADIHLRPTEAPTDADVPIGFHIQLGHSAAVAAGQSLQLSNYEGVMKGLLATGPLAFEAYNGSFCPPVTGYYYLGAIVHLTSSLSPSHSEGEVAPLVTVSICIFGSCSDERVASLEAVSTTRGLQTVSVSGLLYISVDDAVVLKVRAGNATTISIRKHTSFMGFLWGRSASQ